MLAALEVTMFENKGPQHPSFPDFHMSKGFAPNEIPTLTKITWLDRFYVRSGDVLIKLGSALKKRSAITQQPYEPAMYDSY
jgi:hypothetical protein